MRRTYIIKNVLGNILFVLSICFAMYICYMIFAGNSSIDGSGMIICLFMMAVPLIPAIWLYTNVANTEFEKLRIVKTGIWLYFGFYMLLMASMLCLRYVLHMNFGVHGIHFFNSMNSNVNLVPFKTIFDYISRIKTNAFISIYNLAGNLAVFAPMGFFLPALFPLLRRYTSFILTMLIIIVFVELSQLLLHTGAFDVDDIILNLLGAALSFWLWRCEFMQKLMKRAYML